MANIHKNKRNPSLEVKSSRVTIDSKICNKDKYNELSNILNSSLILKNKISKYCHENLIELINNPYNFKSKYKLFSSDYLNSWEIQNIFHLIVDHYLETYKRYNQKTNYNKYLYNSNNGLNIKKDKSSLQEIIELINTYSYLEKSIEVVKSSKNVFIHKNKRSINIETNKKIVNYKLNYDFNTVLENISLSIETLKLELAEINKNIILNNKDNKKNIEDLLKSHKTISTKITKKEEYLDKVKLIITNYNKLDISKQNRITSLVINKKLSAFNKVKLITYKTGTYTQSLKFSNIEIVEDLTNNKYKYFLKVKREGLMKGKIPKFKEGEDLIIFQERLVKYNDNNYLFLPITFNKGKLKSINKTIKNILTSDNPQILIQASQTRRYKDYKGYEKGLCESNTPRKINIIFNYELESDLSKVVNSNINPLELQATTYNTLGLDINLKNNLLMDSNGVEYKDLLGDIKFSQSINKMITIYSKDATKRTLKEKITLEKILRTNENIIKEYLSELVEIWKSNGIKHLVLEDLNFINDKTLYKHPTVEIKYSRLSRLLRIGQIKKWLFSIGEKKGLFVHIVNSAYTSQECSKCHYIDNGNRLTQESFKCIKCGFGSHSVKFYEYKTGKGFSECDEEKKCTADYNSALSIKNRFLDSVLSNKLNEQDVLGRVSKKKNIYYKQVKNIVSEHYNINVYL